MSPCQEQGKVVAQEATSEAEGCAPGVKRVCPCVFPGQLVWIPTLVLLRMPALPPVFTSPLFGHGNPTLPDSLLTSAGVFGQSQGRGQCRSCSLENRQEISVPGDRLVRRHLAARAGFSNTGPQSPQVQDFPPCQDASPGAHCMVWEVGAGWARHV